MPPVRPRRHSHRGRAHRRHRSVRQPSVWLAVGMLLLAFVSAYAAVWSVRVSIARQVAQPLVVEMQPVPSPSAAPVSQPPAASAGPSAAALPPSVRLDVPFTVQAPGGVWDALHEEACEEASLAMLWRFRSGRPFASPQDADAEMAAIIRYEESQGYGVDVTVAQLSAIAKGLYGLGSGRVETAVSAEALRRELAFGRPVIVPAAGRELHNPNFTQPGPPYHMLVLVGYDGDAFVTNDPGTRKGEGFTYDAATLLAAIHDWTGSPETIGSGGKAYLVFD